MRGELFPLPRMRLRRENDSEERDFYRDSNRLLDLSEIREWAAGSAVFVVCLYDEVVGGAVTGKLPYRFK